MRAGFFTIISTISDKMEGEVAYSVGRLPPRKYKRTTSHRFNFKISYRGNDWNLALVGRKHAYLPEHTRRVNFVFEPYSTYGKDDEFVLRGCMTAERRTHINSTTNWLITCEHAKNLFIAAMSDAGFSLKSDSVYFERRFERVETRYSKTIPSLCAATDEAAQTFTRAPTFATRESVSTSDDEGA